MDDLSARREEYKAEIAARRRPYVAGLRRLADVLDDHPEVPIRGERFGPVEETVFCYLTDGPLGSLADRELTAAADEVRPEKDEHYDGLHFIFGPIDYYVYWDRPVPIYGGGGAAA